MTAKGHNLHPARLIVDNPAPPFDGAPCLDLYDKDLMFPFESDVPGIEFAKEVCAGCDHRPECLAWALDHNIEFGVWGGVTEDERKRIRRGQARARQRAARRNQP
jgi:WhiB family transcriptional regulator, redox-sensing transcriptional regulator